MNERVSSMTKDFELLKLVAAAMLLAVVIATPLSGQVEDAGPDNAAGQSESATASSVRPSTEQPVTSAELLELEHRAFQAAVARAAPSVLQIETFGGMERVGEALVAEGPTTGLVIAKEGWIISSLYSFRQQPASIVVTLANGERAPARIVARDFSRELALLKIETETELSVARVSQQLDSLPQLIGSWSIALGKTYDKQQVSQSLGIISAVDRAYGRAIQTDAKISPINYGGPLIDLSGDVLGVLAPISPGAFLEGDSSQLYDSGIGFAIPLDSVLERLPIMQAGQDIQSGKLGIVTSDQNEMAGPVIVAGAMPGSPAARAGVKAGDTLVEAAGQPVRLLAQFRNALGPTDVGQSFTFTVDRDGRRIELSTTLIEKIPTYNRRYLGMRLSELDEGGLEIVAIEPDSPATDSQLKPGDVLIGCDGIKLESAQELRKLLAVAELDKALELEIRVGVEKSSDDTERELGKVEPALLNVTLTPQTWPVELASTWPPVPAEIKAADATQIVDINLGDFPNKAFAVIPTAATRSLGLMIVFPEPGEVDREKTQNHWASFANRFGWIVAVINSGDARQWTMEEIELAGRVLGRMQKNYNVDSARTVLMGLGVGGRMALVAGSSLRDKVSGIVTVGTDAGRFRVKQPNAPLQSLDFMLVGNPEQLGPSSKSLIEAGYSVILQPSTGTTPQQWETHPQSEIELWLEGLARF